MIDVAHPIKAFTPRLLPVTMGVLAALLVVKSVSLVRAAVPAPNTPVSNTPVSNTPGSAGTPAPAAVKPGPRAANPAPVNGKSAPAAAKPEPAAASTPASPSITEPPGAPISDSERTLLLELRQRREELDVRAQTTAAREALLAAAERRITARVEELKALQTRLEALEAGHASRNDANWRGLVKVYETMKPRDAAVIMNELDPAVLLGVLDRMKETKAAPILAAMQPDRARQVTAELAQRRQRANTPPRDGATNNPRDGAANNLRDGATNNPRDGASGPSREGAAANPLRNGPGG